MTKRNILFVCTLNTARSVACMFILQKYAGDRFNVRSCGLASSGSSMSPTLMSALNTYEKIPKEELLEFKSQRFNDEFGNWADTIICVTREHASVILNEYPWYSSKISWFEHPIEDNTRTEESAYLCILNIKRNLNELFDIEKDEIKYTPITSKNYDRIQVLENQIFGKHAYPMKEAFGEHKLSFIAKKKNVDVGYMVSEYVLDQMDIISIGVKSTYRRQGIGEMILRHLIELAKEKGVKSIFLEVRYSNDNARLLYEKVGFVKCGLRSGYYSDPKEDAILYEYEIRE